MENRAAVLLEKGRIVLEPYEMPTPKDDEVLIKMEYAGICGSDVHYFRDGGIGRRRVTFPYILGHECSGEVVGMGKDAVNFNVGDKVVIEPGLGCGTCEYCMEGRYNLCEDMRFLATPPINGCFKNHITYPVRGCFKLPENVSALSGAMIEPLAVGLHAARRGEVDFGKTVVILGMGCIGLMTLLACKAMNADKIIVSDVFDNRLEKAGSLGADYAVNSSKEDLEEHVKQLTGGKGAHIVFEAAGRPETSVQALKLVKRGGVITQVGTIAQPVAYPFNELGKIEVDIRSVFRYRNIFPLALNLLAVGKINLEAIGPDIFDFEDVASAFDCAINNADKVTKCVLKF